MDLDNSLSSVERTVEDLITNICLKEEMDVFKQEEEEEQNLKQQQNEKDAKKEEEEEDKKLGEVEEEPCLQVHVEQLLGDVVSAAFEDFVGEEEERAKAAEALLGGCLDLVCTYPEGYRTRQPLYSCKTCAAQADGQLAGVCYACSENCHVGHDLVELYTKRNFCCDCGNSKFKMRCKLYEEKAAFNSRNIYNENFKGIFCVCKKPYPPEVGEDELIEEGGGGDPFEDMVQCQICEDWFHPSHAVSDPAERSKLERDKEEQFVLVCAGCVQKHHWLRFYHVAENAPSYSSLEGPVEIEKHCNSVCKLERLKMKQKANGQNENEQSGQKKCLAALCFSVNWRSQLCTCNSCKALYDDSDCAFLIDAEDTLEFYEQQNREQMAAAANTQEGKKRQQRENAENMQIERALALKMKSGIEQLKQHCVTFFAKRSAEKRGASAEAITKEDVAECFQELLAKRQRLMEETEVEEEAKERAWTE